MVLITEDAQRTMLTNLAASSQLGPDDIVESEIQKAKYVYIEGYLFGGEPTKSAALKAIELAKRTVCEGRLHRLGPVPDSVQPRPVPEADRGTGRSAVLQSGRGRALTGKHDPIDCAQEIHKHAENVALTLAAMARS